VRVAFFSSAAQATLRATFFNRRLRWLDRLSLSIPNNKYDVFGFHLDFVEIPTHGESDFFSGDQILDAESPLCVCNRHRIGNTRVSQDNALLGQRRALRVRNAPCDKAGGFPKDYLDVRDRSASLRRNPIR